MNPGSTVKTTTQSSTTQLPGNPIKEPIISDYDGSELGSRTIINFQPILTNSIGDINAISSQNDQEDEAVVLKINRNYFEIK